MINTEDVFAELTLGLALFAEEPTRWAQEYPPGLIRAMSGIALSMERDFPKTFTAFLALCHKPLSDWYPYPLADFRAAYALLDKGQLTEQASDFVYSLPDELLQQHHKNGYVPASVLDNLEILRFIQRMRGMENATDAQRLYVTVRSFLIEHSWITKRDLIDLKRQDISEEMRDWLRTTFYQQDDSGEEVFFCDHCGILQRVDGQLVGMKPVYCDDHQPDSPFVHAVSVSSFSRMKMGIHLRTFIPGRAELALFTKAESLHDEYPEHLVGVERYSGLDAYDVRLVFRDETWAVDVKDLADPQDLSRKIRPMAKGKNLDHDKAFYVVPDRRLQLMTDYLEQVRRHSGPIKPPLYLLSQEDFCARMRSKCTELIKASR